MLSAKPRSTSWRERALNAEAMLKTAHEEIVKQRSHIGELMGQQDRRIADLEVKLIDPVEKKS